MVVFRYLSREVFLTLLAVTGILLIIIMSGRFINYLEMAVAGSFQPQVLLSLMYFRIPEFLKLVLPLSLFLSILLIYGRMYIDNEMTVLQACGMSNQRLLLITLFPALTVAATCALLSLYLAPKGLENFTQIVDHQNSLTEFDNISAGRFQVYQGGKRVTYTNSVSPDKKDLGNVFISELFLNEDVSKINMSVTLAEKGHQQIDANGVRYVVLENGRRYDGLPGRLDFRVVEFEQYGLLISNNLVESADKNIEAISTGRLFHLQDLDAKVELNWRFGVPVLAFIVSILAVGMSRVSPRQGRFLRLIPAILLYVTYLGLLIVARGEKSILMMWAVHFLWLVIALVWVGRVSMMLRWRSYKWQQNGKPA